MATLQSIGGVKLSRRAAMALDSFPPKDKKKIHTWIGRLQSPTAREIPRRSIRKLPTPEPIFSLRVSPDIRVIFSWEGETIEILDILRRSTLDSFLKKPANPIAKMPITRFRPKKWRKGPSSQ